MREHTGEYAQGLLDLIPGDHDVDARAAAVVTAEVLLLIRSFLTKRPK
jgi:hypothetical protein